MKKFICIFIFSMIFSLTGFAAERGVITLEKIQAEAQPMDELCTRFGLTANAWNLQMPLRSGGAYQIHAWQLQPVESRGVVVLVHGLKDHSHRYFKMACEELTVAGYSVYALDLPHHGRSLEEGEQAPTGEIDSIEDNVRVVDNFLRFVREREGIEKPLVLFGHSMGGLVAASYAYGIYPGLGRLPEGLILSGPALKTFEGILPSLQVLATRILPSWTPKLLIPDFLKNKLFSHADNYVEKLENDPHVYSGKHSIRVAKALIRGISQFRQSLPERLKDPGYSKIRVLLTHGQADKITNPRGSRELAQKLWEVDAPAQLRTWGGLFHDLFNEALSVPGSAYGRGAVRRECESWLRQNF